MERKSQSGQPLTVVFVETASAMGGVQFSTLYLAERLDRTLWKPVVICPEDGELPNACRDAGIEVHVLEHPQPRSTSLRAGRKIRVPNPAAWAWNGFALGVAARRLRRFLDRSRPSLVVTKGLSAHFFGALAARKLGIPCVWHAQDLISERSLGIYRRAFGRAARWLPEQIIADGASIAAQLPRPLQSRVTVIHNGVDTKTFHPDVDGGEVRSELGIPSDHLVVGHMARVTPWKGQHYLIEAFAGIAKDFPKVTLLLVGAPVFDNDSYERRLRQMVSELGLEERVRFAGYRHDTAKVLAAMDVFAFTSIEKDTSPLALLSAMSSGLPIAAFDIAGVEELIEGSDECLLTVPRGNSGDLATALLRLIGDEKLRLRLGQSVRRLAEQRFSLDRHVESIEKVLAQVAHRRLPTPETDQVPSLTQHSLPNAHDAV